nr:hypothetical protein [Fodinicola feengrottensis]
MPATRDSGSVRVHELLGRHVEEGVLGAESDDVCAFDLGDQRGGDCPRGVVGRQVRPARAHHLSRVPCDRLGDVDQLGTRFDQREPQCNHVQAPGARGHLGGQLVDLFGQ